MNWIDTHAHLDLPRFGDDADRRAAAVRAQSAGIVSIVIPGVEPAGWDGMLATAAQLREAAPFVGFHTALGIHPQVLPEIAAELDAAHIEQLEQRVLAAPAGMVAIGECGLDFGAEIEAGAARARQIAVLKAHFALARRTGLPLLLHCLRAHAVLLELLRAAPLPPSILHSWSGSAELAALFCRAGHFISFAGSITLPRARRPLESARAVPADRLLLETDSPDQTPFNRRPAGNEPAFLLEVAAAVAAARDETLAALAEQTTANARRVLGLA
ncbi:MAG: TatD family hydrolase [Nannocystis sp.]|nr:TatD family hydrolase [Nannocystis sp.]MBA3546674.1 TatD family hydrolase [Nannocystis sp.]